MIQIPPHIKKLAEPPIMRVKEWKKLLSTAGRDIIDLGQAVPSYPPPPAVIRQIAFLAGEPGSYFYSPDQGIEEVLKTVADFYEQSYDASVSKENIILTAGANNAFSSMVWSLFTRGDEILVPEPYYFNHVMMLEASGCIPRFVPAGESEGFHPSIERMEKAINEKTRALVLVTPHNPTGFTAPSGYLEHLYAWSVKRNLFLILDETYQDFSSEPGTASFLLRKPGWEENLIHLYTFSKSLSLSGMRVGILMAGPRVIKEVLKIHDCNLICAPVLAQKAVAFGLRHEIPWLDEKVRDMKNRIESFILEFKAVRQGFSLVCYGAFFAYIRHHFPFSSWKVAESLAKRENILCVPGEAFGINQGNYLRFALGNVEKSCFGDLMLRLNRFTP